MMMELLLHGEPQAILPKSYIDMLIAEYRYDFILLDYDECIIEYTLEAGSRNITFDDWYIIENDGNKKHAYIDLYSRYYQSNI